MSERMDYLLLLYGATEEQLRNLFKDHLESIAQTGLLYDHGKITDLELRYVPDLMCAYKSSPIHLTHIGSLLERETLNVQEQIFIAETTLLLVGFFGAKGKPGRWGEYHIRKYAMEARDCYGWLYLELHKPVYLLMYKHFETWLYMLQVLGNRFQEQNLDRYMIRS